MDSDLKRQLEEINQNLVSLKRQGRVRNAFWRGVLSGMGSVLGVAVVLVMIGWILNAVGVIPAFREQAQSLRSTLEEIKRLR